MRFGIERLSFSFPKDFLIFFFSVKDNCISIVLLNSLFSKTLDMQLSFTEKKNIRKTFGKLKESLSIPNLIEVQKNSYKELTENKKDVEAYLVKGFDRVFKSIFPIEDLNDKASLEYVSYRLEKPKFDVDECIARG